MILKTHTKHFIPAKIARGERKHEISDDLATKLFDEISSGTGVDDDENAHADPMAVDIMEDLAFKENKQISTINYPNNGTLSGLPNSMVMEGSAEIVDGALRFRQLEELPPAINQMVRTQGVINDLLVQAFLEKSRKTLLQALMIDPTTPSYRGAVNVINKMFEMQKDILPPI